MTKDYYQILGVAKTASMKEIKRAFYALARKFHPDKNRDTADLFNEILEAYSCLSDAEKELCTIGILVKNRSQGTKQKATLTLQNTMVALQTKPMLLYCKWCKINVYTKTKHKTGDTSRCVWAAVFLSGLCTFGITSLLSPMAFLFNRFKNVHHKCPVCGGVIGVYHR